MRRGACGAARRRRVLVLSFHDGVTASLQWAAARHGWEVEAPRVDDVMGGCDAADAQQAGGGFLQVSKRYVFSRQRSECLWRDGSLQAYLERFQLVVVADTTAIARPMLQHGWPGGRSGSRLLLWVCNRFDYGVVGDDEYYALFRALPTLPRVRCTPLPPTPLVLRPKFQS